MLVNDHPWAANTASLVNITEKQKKTSYQTSFITQMTTPGANSLQEILHINHQWLFILKETILKS